MTHYEIAQSEAMGNHGIVTVASARRMGISPVELARWCKRGKLMRVGHGVYRFTSYPASGIISDLAAVLAGIDGAYLYGESVIQLLNLCPTRSYLMQVAVPRRIRRKIPDGVEIVRGADGYEPVWHEGLPCQKLEDAIKACKGRMDADRLLEAVAMAEQKGYFMPEEVARLKGEFEHGKTSA